jgi:tRNA G18 (ribose-2'-O)-methylase SpoU
MSEPVGQLRGVQAIAEALDRGREIGLLLVCEDAADPALAALAERAEGQGVPVRRASAAVLRRMTANGPPADVLALVGRRPTEDLESVLRRGGAVWLLAQAAYPTNVGVAIRTAEGSGATAIAVDAPFDHDGRRAALRAAMRADWYMPVFWQPADAVVAQARRAGLRIVGVENSGVRAPWDEDLTAPSLFIIGGESHGIPADLLDACDAVVRVPMGGFIPSYNLQIPLGVVAAERLRQLAQAGAPALASGCTGRGFAV